ncbi:hypothetical protein MUK70_19680 [Dyadobacter chenwenxiniae]|uniref:Uncharacterized protein n=1 Tax=Dyadobacter chenwenxiniae TaxID=2906456 RepID=A0A9X1PN17_9BACT|nr:hypothetical protein [Dyadobacter chenwenxiniae]MCF0052978.1 hypothetical protein [Dyadobacter chenwenxiniae]MCF0061461.1 hypothetical protein [Dyadobacter chenwenxiniae]UON81284.1 hypothetical protein MUK70_19680 [Dyadobacter chenwenxiniae]
METLIIQGDDEQISTLKAFLKTVGINYQTCQEQDTTDYLLSNSTNKTELLDSIQEAKDGKTRKIGLDDIWK